jgi:hypothetical protein
MDKFVIKEKESRETQKIIKNISEDKFDIQTKTFYVGKKQYRRGVTRLLKTHFYSNYKAPAKKRAKRGSSKALGSYFHRQVYHHFTCLSEGHAKCSCKTQFGKPTRALKKGSLSYNRIKALKYSLNRFGIEIVSCEVPVAWSKVNTATCLDALARSKSNPNEFYVLEFKTGYSTGVRKRASTQNGYFDKGVMTGLIGKEIPNSPFNQHQLQLFFGMECFRDTHKKSTVKDGLLMYFDGRGKCKTERFSKWKYATPQYTKQIKKQIEQTFRK